MAYIFIVNYSVLFGLFNFGLGLDLGFKVLASASINISDKICWQKRCCENSSLSLIVVNV